MEAIATPFEAEARELHVWRQSLYTYELPIFQVDEDLTLQLGYLFQDGTIAYSGRRGDMKFSIIHQDEQPIPLLKKIGIKLKNSYKNTDSYMTLSYQDALYARRMLDGLTVVIKLKQLHRDFETFVIQNHDESLKTGSHLKVYSDIETVNNKGHQTYWPCYSPDTFSFPLSTEGSTGISYTYAVIPSTLEEELISEIQKITNYTNGIRKQYDLISSEYA